MNMGKKREKSTDQAGSQTNTDKAEQEALKAKDPDQLHTERLSIYKKAGAQRKAEVKRHAEEIGMDAESEEALSHARESLAEGGDEAKAVAKAMAEEQEDEPGDEPESESKGADEKATDDRVANDMVEVVIYGRRYQVPQADIDRAGGVEAYQRTRAANMRMAEAAKLEQRARRREQEAARREKELQDREKRQERSSHPEPSKGSEPPDEGAQQIRKEDRKEQVTAIVERIFSGDKDKASTAIEEILDSVDHKPAVSPEEIAKMAADQLRAEREAEQATAQQEKDSAEAAWEAELSSQQQEVNRVMSDEYADILRDDLRLEVARARFNKLRDQPINAGRSLPDIAREAGEFARGINTGSPAQEMQHRRREKENMPRETPARSKAKFSEEKKVPSAQEHIQRLREARGLSRQ